MKLWVHTIATCLAACLELGTRFLPRKSDPKCQSYFRDRFVEFFVSCTLSIWLQQNWKLFDFAIHSKIQIQTKRNILLTITWIKSWEKVRENGARNIEQNLNSQIVCSHNILRESIFGHEYDNYCHLCVLTMVIYRREFNIPWYFQSFLPYIKYERK